MTGVRAGSQGTGLNEGSQGSGVTPLPTGPLNPIHVSDGFSTTLGPQTFPLPVAAVDGTGVVFLYGCSGTNSIGNPGGGWVPIAVDQRVGAWYKQISGDTVVPAVGASNGYPHWTFMVFDTEIAISQTHAGTFGVDGAQPRNVSYGSSVFSFAQKIAVSPAQSVYGWRIALNDHGATPTAPAVIVAEELTTFGSDSASTLLGQVGEGADIEIGFTSVTTSTGLSFVLEAA